MANRDILAIGTSAGGVEALRFLAQNFPSAFPASVIVTIHLPSHFRSVLDEILTRAGALPASFARDGEEFRKGRIYIAPPGQHLLVEGNRFRLGLGPRENSARPAIDPMLRSTAVCCGGRSIGVVLTGTLSDGASGLAAVHRAGGITVVQDPADAAFSEMPMNALNEVRPDHVVNLAHMPGLLATLAHQPAGETTELSDKIRVEVEIAEGRRSSMDDMDRMGRRSVLSCPDCGGVMWEMEDEPPVRYRCHVGHAYTAELMSLAIDKSLRRALAAAMRALDERIALMERLRRTAESDGRDELAASWALRVRELRREAEVIQVAVERLDRMTAQAVQPTEA